VTARSFAGELHGDRHSQFVKPYVRLLGHWPSLRTYLVVFFEGMLILGSFSYLGAFSSKSLGLGTFEIGLLMAVFGIGVIAASRAAGRLAERIGRNRLVALGLASAAAADLLVAIDLLALLVALLRLHRQRCDRAGFQPLQRDRLAGLLAIAVGVILDALQRRVDLGDQLALPVAGAQFDRAVGLRRCAVGKIGMVDVLFLKRLQRDPRFPQNLVLPRQQLGAKIVALAIVHERLFFGGSIILQLFQGQPIYAFECPFPNSMIPCGILLHELRRQRSTTN